MVFKREDIGWSFPGARDASTEDIILEYVLENERFAKIDYAIVKCLPKHLGGYAWHYGGTNPAEPLHLTLQLWESDKVKTTKHVYLLNESILKLMERIFDEQCINDALNDLNYDSKRCPLLDLNKNTISQGYLILQELSTLIENAPSAQSQQVTVRQNLAKEKSKIYYETLIARSSKSYPVIQTYEILQKEMKFLDSLVELQETCRIMNIPPNDSESGSALDRYFSRLNTEMKPLKKGKNLRETHEIAQYFDETLDVDQKAKRWKIGDIFSIEREEEKTRFQEGRFAGVPGNRRLLWYGARLSTLGGILKHGLRIHGSVPGKGISFSDMCSKAAVDCYPNTSNGDAILLLCEVCVELRGQQSRGTRPSYKEAKESIAKEGPTILVLGIVQPLWKDAGDVGPAFAGVGIPDVTKPPRWRNVPNPQNRFNEYIVYDENQVKLRYLLSVKMT